MDCFKPLDRASPSSLNQKPRPLSVNPYTGTLTRKNTSGSTPGRPPRGCLIYEDSVERTTLEICGCDVHTVQLCTLDRRPTAKYVVSFRVCCRTVWSQTVSDFEIAAWYQPTFELRHIFLVCSSFHKLILININPLAGNTLMPFCNQPLSIFFWNFNNSSELKELVPLLGSGIHDVLLYIRWRWVIVDWFQHFLAYLLVLRNSINFLGQKCCKQCSCFLSFFRTSFWVSLTSSFKMSSQLMRQIIQKFSS